MPSALECSTGHARVSARRGTIGILNRASSERRTKPTSSPEGLIGCNQLILNSSIAAPSQLLSLSVIISEKLPQQKYPRRPHYIQAQSPFFVVFISSEGILSKQHAQNLFDIANMDLAKFCVRCRIHWFVLQSQCWNQYRVKEFDGSKRSANLRRNI